MATDFGVKILDLKGGDDRCFEGQEFVSDFCCVNWRSFRTPARTHTTMRAMPTGNDHETMKQQKRKAPQSVCKTHKLSHLDF